MGAGLPKSIPAHTVTQACISSNQAVSSAVNLIRSGQARVVLAGGTETMSDIPIRFRRKFRGKLLDAQKYKSISDWLSFFKGLRPSDLLPEVPSIEEFSTG
jgi:acetyl-CoA acyltransferase